MEKTPLVVRNDDGTVIEVPAKMVEVVPGLSVSEASIREATSRSVAGDCPSGVTADNRYWADIKADVDASKAVIASLASHGMLVKPIVEHNIQRLQGLMHLSEHMSEEQLPVEILFAIPRESMPMSADRDPSDAEYDMARYVHLDSMPPELRSVVRAYRGLRYGTGTFDAFKVAVAELVTKTLVLAVSPRHDALDYLVPGAGRLDPRSA
jgi:hypothetical protein